MDLALRPYVTTGLAIVGAAVVAAAPVTAPVAQVAPPARTVAVAPTSLITDFLGKVGESVYAAGESVRVATDAVIGLPFDVTLLAGLAVHDPALAQSLGSFLVHHYLDPDSFAFTSTVWLFRTRVIEPLAALLPAPLGPSSADPGLVLDLVATVTAPLAGILAALPDPGVGHSAYDTALWETVPGRLLLAVRQALVAPVFSLVNAVEWLGAAPEQVAKLIETAIASPADIPGLLSQAVHSIADPNTASLIGLLMQPFLWAGQLLPAPLGDTFGGNAEFGLISTVYNAVADLVTNALNAVLPTPVQPTAKMAAGSVANGAPAQALQVQSPDVADPPADAARLVTLDVPEALPAPDPGRADGEGAQTSSDEAVSDETHSPAPEVDEPQTDSAVEADDADAPATDTGPTDAGPADTGSADTGSTDTDEHPADDAPAVTTNDDHQPATVDTPDAPAAG